MRTIKFRAWDKENKEMCIVNDLVFMFESENGVMASVIDTSGSEPNEYTRMVMPEHLELMQFTGLLDKNGKEIYEEDIMQGWHTEEMDTGIGIDTLSMKNEISKVEWDNDMHGFNLWGSDEFEVIGNIYENPELLASGSVAKV